MPKQRHADYAAELRDQIAAWDRKPALRAVYAHWYERLVAALSPLTPTVEIGSGCGNFKRFYPQAVATDVQPVGEWIDQIVDARALPFAEGSIGNFVLIDCLHHLPRPIRFLRSAARCLQPGGRIVLLEPAVTPWSRIVWRLAHHEPVDCSVDLFREDTQPEPDNPGFEYANMATAHLLFTRGRDQLEAAIPDLPLLRIEFSDAFAYLATGGFNYPGLLPAPLLAAAHRTELRYTPDWLARLAGLRMLIVLERTRNATRGAAGAPDSGA